MFFLMFLSCTFAAAPACAAEVGRVKTVTGAVHIERGGERVPAIVDARIQSADTVVTGANSSVGIMFLDDSRLSAGPNSTLVIDRYAFDQTTHVGNMDATLKRGTLAVVSGRMVKQSPEALTVTTPGLILGVRGTEFLVSAE
jgi:hypothetical protein